jgi:hypothetical protein
MRSSVFTLLFTLVAAFHTVIPTWAEAADVGLFRMKRTWWGGTSTNSPADPYISTDYHPRLKGPNKAPPAEAYVGFSTTANGAKLAPAPRFTAPSKFIVDYTRYVTCTPVTCPPGYPESKAWYSYWNLKGSFRPNNSRYGGASMATTVVFPTTMGNPTPPFNEGEPAKYPGGPISPTTTPCVSGGAAGGGCGYWAHDFGTHMAGDKISFVGGNYDFDRAGSMMVTPGKNRFGGTMHFFYGPNERKYRYNLYFYPYPSKSYGRQTDVRDPAADTHLGDVQFGGGFNIYRMTAYGQQRSTSGTPSSPGDDYVVQARNFYTLAPFTTGMVTAWQPFGNTNTVFTLTGYDNRTPNGLSGVISLVRPRLVHTYKIPNDPNEPTRVMASASASAWQMKFHFICPYVNSDGDGVGDRIDNCSEDANTGQDDTDADGYGNICDADYDNSGIVGFPDFGEFVRAFGSTDMEKCHNEPIPGCIVGFPDFGAFVAMFGSSPGPGPAETTCP